MALNLPDLNFDPNMLSRTNYGMDSILGTLTGINKARAGFLENQKAMATLPYAGPQASANVSETNARTGLLGQQTKYFPQTTMSALLGNAARAAGTLNPLGAFKNSDPTTRAIASNAMVKGEGGLGNVAFNTKTYNAISQLVGKVLQGFPGMGGQDIVSQLQGGSTPSQQSSVLQTLPTDNPTPPSSMPALPQSQADKDRLDSVNWNAAVGSPIRNPGEPQSSSGYSSPEELASYNDQQKAATQMKAVGSGPNRNYGYVKNALISLGKIDPSKFSRYMGAKGQAQLRIDAANSAITGNPNSDYNKYLAFEKNLPFINDQIAKYNQASISPHAAELREAMLNPVTMRSNVSSAMLQLRRLKQLMTQEGKTWADQVGKKEEYKQFEMPEDGSDILKDMQKIKRTGEDPKSYLASLDPQEQALAIKAFRQGKKNAK